jgi:hypothetical protein
MIELKKQALLGAFGVASPKSMIVIPWYDLNNCLKLITPGKKIDWPDLLVISDQAVSIFKVRASEAYTLLPFKRLDHSGIHQMGLLALRNVIEGSTVTYIVDGDVTYQDLASVALKNNCVRHIHKLYTQLKKDKTNE